MSLLDEAFLLAMGALPMALHGSKRSFGRSARRVDALLRWGARGSQGPAPFGRENPTLKG